MNLLRGGRIYQFLTISHFAGFARWSMLHMAARHIHALIRSMNLSPHIRHAIHLLFPVVFASGGVAGQVVFSEIHYHPIEEPAFDNTTNYNPTLDLSEDVHEFVEIQNTTAAAVDLGGWKVGGDIDFTLPVGTSVAAGAYKVIARNPTRIQTVYGITGVLGGYTGKLPNSGGNVTLKDASGNTVDSVSYSSAFPWAQSANALGAQDRFTGLTSSTYQYKGRSLQRVSATASSGDPANWVASPLTGPTPSTAQSVVRTVPKPVVIALSHAQTSDGSAVVSPSQGVTVNCTFSSTATLGNVQLEWFVDTADSTTETHTTTTMTDLGDGRFSAAITGQAARAVVRYRILANRGDGSEVVSPRSDDPAISAVGASNAVQPWHGYFVNPTGRSATYPNYDLLISTANLATIKSYAQQGGSSSTSTRRVTAASTSGLPRSVPWVAATAPLWDGTVPAVFACNGVLYDVRIRFHGSRYHRYDNAANLLSFKLHFPECEPFMDKTSWFITSHGQDFHEATQLNRLIGLPASRTLSVTWYFNSNASATRLQQGEYDGTMLDDYHQSMADRSPGSAKEAAGLLYKDVGNRDASANNLEGPYTCGDMAPIAANANWTKYQRYEWTYSLQNSAWQGPKPFANMLEAMWAARGDTTATHNFSSNSTQLANCKTWFNSNYDMESTLTSMALIEWMSIWDDGKQNQFYWRKANGKWSRLGWDYDGVMSTGTGGGGGPGGSYTQTIWGGEYGATNVFDGVNWWKDTFYKCFRDEYKQRLWQINNSFCDPANLLALGFTTTSKCYLFAQKRQTQVNTQLGLGTYYKPARPTNTSPSANGVVLSGASLAASAYSHPNSKAHASTKWEIRSSAGNYELPVYAVTTSTNLTTLPVPYDSLAYGQTYYWRVTYTDSDGHASVISAETAFTWGSATTTAGTLVLNEILADNAGAAANGTAYPDYIEIRNNGTAAYNLTGLTLTDDPAVPAKFAFPSGTALTAGSHLVIWCDKDTTAPGQHTGFALDSSGQTVLLMNGTTILDSLTFGPQAADLSIGRIANGTGTWTANTPTPAATNTAATLGTTSTLRINEWMASAPYEDDWFELQNSGTAPVALAGLYLSDTPSVPTITRIPPYTYIGAGGFTRFAADGSASGGNHCDFKLSASGDSIVLTASNGVSNLDSVTFSTQSQEISQGRIPDGSATLATFANTASPGKPNWLAAQVVINEVMANPASGGMDWIELSNTGISAADVGGWWLSDSIHNPKKFQIPTGTTIPAGGFAVFTESDFAAGAVPFGLSATGDDVCLAAANGSGALTGYRSQVSFSASTNGLSWGRIAATGLANGTGGTEFWSLASSTQGAANSAPSLTPVLINEIMYHPLDGAAGADVTATEFIELHNPTNSAVDLSGWRIKGDSSYTFASGTILPAFGYLLVVPFNPATDTSALTGFLTTYGLDIAPAMAGPSDTKLSNATHKITLARPFVHAETTEYLDIDRTEYRDIAPWPTAPDGGGVSLQRISRDLIGNTAANWGSATPTPGTINAGLYQTLAVWSRSPLPEGAIGSPYAFAFVGVGGTAPYIWTLASGSLPPGVSLTNGMLGGTPTGGGSFAFTIRLADYPGASATADFTLTVPSGDTDGDDLPDDWELENGLAVGTDDSALDADGDGQSNLAEYLAGTDPRSSASVFAITSVGAPDSGTVTVTWSGIAGRTYQLWSSADLTTWTPVNPPVFCATTGPVAAAAPTEGSAARFFKVAVVP